MKRLQIIFNILFISIISFFLLNFTLGIVWEIRTNLKFKNYKPYDDVVLKTLNLSEEDGLKLYLETYVNRKFDYDQFTEHAENNGYNNKFVNVTPSLGRKTISPKICKQNIFFYGGSTTFGYNVTDHQTIASYLGKVLIKNNYKICVKNFGRGSYFSTQENILFQKHILNKKINSNDVIIFIDGINEGGIKNSRNTAFLFETMKAINQDYWDMYKYTFPIFFQSLSINQFIYRLKAKITANMKNNNLDQHRNRQGQKNIFDFKNNMKEVYQKNVLFRKGICNELNLNCFSFLQPFATQHGNYFNKPISGAPETRILNLNQHESLKKKYDILKDVEYIIDISNSLDLNKSLSYVDAVHYSPLANKAIANKVYTVIKDVLYGK